jgi:hypothetical protein
MHLWHFRHLKKLINDLTVKIVKLTMTKKKCYLTFFGLILRKESLKKALNNLTLFFTILFENLFRKKS